MVHRIQAWSGSTVPRRAQNNRRLAWYKSQHSAKRQHELCVTLRPGWWASALGCLPPTSLNSPNRAAIVPYVPSPAMSGAERLARANPSIGADPQLTFSSLIMLTLTWNERLSPNLSKWRVSDAAKVVLVRYNCCSFLRGLFRKLLIYNF